MQLPDGSILMHGANTPYDPKKAHEYYMRTRHLKGRKTGNSSYTVQLGQGKSVILTPQQLTEQKAYAAHRVAQIKKNLSDLSVILRDKLEKAKESAKAAAKPPTLAEKAKAARDAEAYRKSHKQELSNKAKTAASKAPAKKSTAATPKADTVDSLKQEITKTKANLKAAVAKQRNLAAAKKNG